MLSVVDLADGCRAVGPGYASCALLNSHSNSRVQQWSRVYPEWSPFFKCLGRSRFSRVRESHGVWCLQTLWRAEHVRGSVHHVRQVTGFVPNCHLDGIHFHARSGNCVVWRRGRHVYLAAAK